MVESNASFGLDPGTISGVVEQYMGGSTGVCLYDRPQSWDFCYNHFLDLERVIADRQASAMQLGYYLASWGMLRGSGYLFRKTNARHYLDVIRVVEEYDDAVRGITPARFGETEVQRLLTSLYQDLGSRLLPEGGRRITLVTKTLMGVWGVFPSLDGYFTSTFNELAQSSGRRKLFSRFTENTIEFTGEFYAAHRDELEGLAAGYQTVDFYTGEASNHPYPVAKIIDIYGFNAAFSS